MSEERLPRCILLTPRPGAPVTDVVKDVLESADFDVLLSSAEGEEEIFAIRALRHGDIVLADITGLNKGVIFNVGFAYGLQKTVIPFVDRKEQTVPRFFGGRLYLVYDEDDLKSFSNVLRSYVQSFVSFREALSA